MEQRENAKTCKNCMREQYCERRSKGKKCYAHKAIYERLHELDMTTLEYEEFGREWDKARMQVRRKFGYGSRRQLLQWRE